MKSINLRVFIMCFIPFILFSGCTFKVTKNVKPDGEISSISITQNHMNSAECYSFSAYSQDEKYYLNAWCQLILNNEENDYRNVDLQNISITKEEYDEFSNLDEKYDFTNHLKRENKKIFKAKDKTTKSFTVSYNGQSISVDTESECYQAVYDYFVKLSEKYIGYSE